MNEVEFRKAFTVVKKKAEPKVVTHIDADGIYSACLIAEALQKPFRILFPEKEFGEDRGADIMLDMRPVNPEYSGLVIDHHLPHPEQRSYKLYSGSKPTGLLVWELFKHVIPKDKWWYAVGAATGDGQAEKVPVEVFDAYPVLLSNASKIYGRYETDVSLYMYPMYRKLSAVVNDIIRAGAHPERAYQEVRQADSPMHLIESTLATAAKKEIRKELTRIKDNYPMYEVGPIKVLFYSSADEKNVTSYIASISMGKLGNVLIIDESRGICSYRGELSFLAQRALRDAGVEIDGHPGYMGGKLTTEYSRFKVLESLKVLTRPLEE